MAGEMSHRIFSAEEKEILINLIKENNVIKDKRTDVFSVAKKKAAWQEIERQFNSNDAVSKRTLSQLKKCWDNIKTKRKRDIANDMRQLMKTGGGPPPPAPLISPELELAVAHLGHSGGFRFDSDADAIRPSAASSTPVSATDFAAAGSSFITQDQPFTSPPQSGIRKRCTRESLVEEELEMRMKTYSFQLECDEKLQSLWENELQILVEDARERRENTRREEERRRQSFEQEEERKRLAFEREEERKRVAFEREEERKRDTFERDEERKRHTFERNEERKQKAFETEERRKEEMHLWKM